MTGNTTSLTALAQAMPEIPRRVLAGISGGADSVALLHLLLLRGCEIHAVHVNHGLRGEASDGDEALVRDLCASRGVPLTVFRLQPPEHPGEDWARRERYGCFRQAAEESGISTLVLAHHRDDQAETLLLHLMRGAGLTGLAGMAADSEAEGLRILRPLLTFSRQQLRQALEQAEIPWREDQSNQDPRYLRNVLRLEVLPLMEQLLPGCSSRLAATAEILQADEATLQALTQQFLAPYGSDCCLPLSPLLAQPSGMQRRILRQWWASLAGAREERSLSRTQTEALMLLLQGKACSRCNLPGGWHAYRGWTHLHLLTERTNTPDVIWKGDVPAGCVIRTRQTGDWLRLPGCRRTLQDFFTDRKVDAPFRDRIPLLCQGSEVHAIAGLWPKDRRGLWEGRMPWAQERNIDHE